MRITVPVENLTGLPMPYRITVPHEYMDKLGHMNVRNYMAIFDDAAWRMMARIGLDDDYYTNKKCGNFALKQYVHYLAEVREGETVAIYCRFIGRSAKRIHKMYFMVNETLKTVAAISETLASHADLLARRTAPWPEDIAKRIDEFLAQANTLDWDPPLTGTMRA